MTTDWREREQVADASHDGGRVATAVAADARRVKRRELGEALHRLELHHDLTDDQRDAVAALADAVVDSIVGGPTAHLRTTSDRTVVEDARTLFDCPDAPRGPPATADPTTRTGATDGD